MDIYCTGCGEPWAVSCLADPLEHGLTVNGSRITRCGGCDTRPASEPRPARALAAEALGDLMPDDPDGVAAMLEDAEAWGLI